MRYINSIQLLSTCFIFALCACKKNDSSSSEKQINAAGTWSLFSYNSQQNGNKSTVYTATEFPCLANNKLEINSDGTLKGKYIGNDTCYILHTTAFTISIGMRGDSTSGTWSQHENVIYMNFLNKIYTARLSTINGALQFVESDSVPYMNTIITDIYTK